MNRERERTMDNHMLEQDSFHKVFREHLKLARSMRLTHPSNAFPFQQVFDAGSVIGQKFCSAQSIRLSTFIRFVANCTSFRLISCICRRTDSASSNKSTSSESEIVSVVEISPGLTRAELSGMATPSLHNR